jgi:chaperone required for assembly of F1-ATPase
MRDILSELKHVSDPNPMVRAQKLMQTPLAKRFYAKASVGQQGSMYCVNLDGKPVKTPARKLLAFPTNEAAALVAAEFAAQIDEINPSKMPATRLANSAIDGVAEEMDAVLEDVLRFAGNDMICYRAEGPDQLVLRQTDMWDRYIDWMHKKFGARLYLTEGVMHVAQPNEAIAALATALRPFDTPLALAAVHAMTTLTGSALLSLAVAHGEVDAAEAWKAAHLEEDWTVEQWGEDFEAKARREYRWLEMEAASKMLNAVSLI